MIYIFFVDYSAWILVVQIVSTDLESNILTPWQEYLLLFYFPKNMRKNQTKQSKPPETWIMAFFHTCTQEYKVKSIPLCHSPTVFGWVIILTSALFSNQRHHSSCQHCCCSLEPLRKDMRISLVDHVQIRGLRVYPFSLPLNISTPITLLIL